MYEARSVYRKYDGKWKLVCTCEWAEDARWIARLLSKDDEESRGYAYTDEDGELTEM